MQVAFWFAVAVFLPTECSRRRSVSTSRLFGGNCILALDPHAFPRIYPVAERILICLVTEEQP
jgi:hypothetical protein